MSLNKNDIIQFKDEYLAQYYKKLEYCVFDDEDIKNLIVLMKIILAQYNRGYETLKNNSASTWQKIMRIEIYDHICSKQPSLKDENIEFIEYILSGETANDLKQLSSDYNSWAYRYGVICFLLISFLIAGGLMLTSFVAMPELVFVIILVSAGFFLGMAGGYALIESISMRNKYNEVNNIAENFCANNDLISLVESKKAQHAPKDAGSLTTNMFMIFPSAAGRSNGKSWLHTKLHIIYEHQQKDPKAINNSPISAPTTPSLETRKNIHAIGINNYSPSISSIDGTSPMSSRPEMLDDDNYDTDGSTVFGGYHSDEHSRSFIHIGKGYSCTLNDQDVSNEHDKKSIHDEKSIDKERLYPVFFQEIQGNPMHKSSTMIENKDDLCDTSVISSY